MAGRRFIRNDFTRYESVALVMVESDPKEPGPVCDAFPPTDSPLRLDSFFARLYEIYDLRFPFRAAHLPRARRVTWSEKSPLFAHLAAEANRPLHELLGYSPRLGA